VFGFIAEEGRALDPDDVPGARRQPLGLSCVGHSQTVQACGGGRAADRSDGRDPHAESQRLWLPANPRRAATRGRAAGRQKACGAADAQGAEQRPDQKRRGRTTIRVSGVPVCEDLVDRAFAPAAANRVWVADIAYLRAWEGWLYLAAVQDLCSSRMSAGAWPTT
jgi:transposase InsO family protein